MTKDHVPGARRAVPRSRGAVSGLALMVLGAWGALIPFIGPYFNFSFTPDDAWHFTSARGWLEVLPGAAAFVAGFLLATSRSRTMTLVAAWLGVAAGAWFAVGLQLQSVWHIGSPGQPAGSGSGIRALEVLALFPLLGVVIVYFAASAFGRLSVVSLRDQRAADQRESEAAEAREREAAAQQDREAAAVHEREVYAAQKRLAAEQQERATTETQSRVTTDSHRPSRDHRALNAQAPDRDEVQDDGSTETAAPVQRPQTGAQHAYVQQNPQQQNPQQQNPQQQNFQQQNLQQQPQQPGVGASAAPEGEPEPKQGWLQRTLHRN